MKDASTQTASVPSKKKRRQLACSKPIRFDERTLSPPPIGSQVLPAHHPHIPPKQPLGPQILLPVDPITETTTKPHAVTGRFANEIFFPENQWEWELHRLANAGDLGTQYQVNVLVAQQELEYQQRLQQQHDSFDDEPEP